MPKRFIYRKFRVMCFEAGETKAVWWGIAKKEIMD